GGKHQAALQVFDAVGKRTGQLGAFVEADQEELILRVGGLEELQGRFAGLAYLVGHTAAEIKNYADRDGHVLGGKRDYFLLDVVFVDAEVVGIEAGNESIVRIGDRHINQRHLQDRKSTRLNSSHQIISYAVFCLKKKKKNYIRTRSTLSITK